MMMWSLSANRLSPQCWTTVRQNTEEITGKKLFFFYSSDIIESTKFTVWSFICLTARADAHQRYWKSFSFSCFSLRERLCCKRCRTLFKGRICTLHNCSQQLYLTAKNYYHFAHSLTPTWCNCGLQFVLVFLHSSFSNRDFSPF